MGETRSIVYNKVSDNKKVYIRAIAVISIAEKQICISVPDDHVAPAETDLMIMMHSLYYALVITFLRKQVKCRSRLLQLTLARI